MKEVAAQVPDEVLHDAALNVAIAVLPANYNFEVRGLVPCVVSPRNRSLPVKVIMRTAC